VGSVNIDVTRPSEIALYVRLFGMLHDRAVYGPDARSPVREAMETAAGT
jgi:hypothetical protein